MKFSHSLLFMSLLLCSQPLVAQAQQFLDFSQWFLTEVNPLGSSFDWYQTGKDSTINGETYHQALKAYDPLPMWLREDAGNQRVYMNAAWNGWNERLLYDFSLQVGDTVELTFRYGGAQRFTLDNIDAVNSTQGFIPRLNLRNLDGNQPAEVKWTPGVGAFSNPFYLDLPNSSDTTYMLICNYHDGTKLWDDGFGNCPGVPPPLSAQGGQAGPLPELELLPNRFGIQFPPGKAWEVEVRDAAGKRVWNRKVQGGEKVQGGAGWNRGLYFLQMRSGDKRFAAKWVASD